MQSGYNKIKRIKDDNIDDCEYIKENGLLITEYTLNTSLLCFGYNLYFLSPSPKPRVFCDKEPVKYKVRVELVKS